MATASRLLTLRHLAGLLALSASLHAQATIPREFLGYDTNIPITAQTTVESLFNHGEGWQTTLLPVGTVLDLVLSGYICLHLSGEWTTEVFAGAEKKIVEAQDDAAMYLATQGAHQGVRLESAIEHLRRFPLFETYSHKDLSELILLVSVPTTDGDA